MSNLNTNVGVDVDVVKEVTAEVEVSAAEVEQPTAVTNGIPPDGKKGEVLTKNSSAPYDASWKKVSDVVGGGLSEEEVKEIVTEATKDLQPKTDESLETESKQVVGAINEVNSGLVKGIDSSITEETNELVLELKGKDGTVLFSTKVQLPKGEVPDLSAYVKTTDYPTGVKAGVVRAAGDNYGIFINPNNGNITLSTATNAELEKQTVGKAVKVSQISKAVKVGATSNTETWTDDETQAARDLIGAVGKEDYPNTKNFKAGVVRIDPYYGLSIGSAGSAGAIIPLWASDSSINARTINRFIGSHKIDYVVLKALSDCKDPSLWTDDTTDENGEVVKGTKTKALELLGAIKADTSAKEDDTVDARVYGIDSNGNQVVYSCKYRPFCNTIAYRDSNSCLAVGTPRGNNDATNKAFVVNLPDNLTLTDDERAKWCELFGALLKGTSSDILCSNGTTLKWDYRVIGGSLIRRYGNGSARVNMPSKIEDESDYDITNRGYVEGKYAELLARIEALENK